MVELLFCNKCGNAGSSELRRINSKCWICKEGTINNSDIKPKYIIHSLKDLFNILEI